MCNKVLIAESNPSSHETRMMNSASTDTIHKRPFIRQVERWLVGMAMTVLAYLMEKAMLRSIKRSGMKSS